MNPGRRIEVPNATMVQVHLAEECDLAVRLRLFLGEASPQLTANTARVWHFGKAEIRKNTAKLKANAIGFYALAGYSASAFLDDSSQEAIVGFLKDIRAANRDYPVIVVLLGKRARLN
jgi:hypothetical protein